MVLSIVFWVFLALIFIASCLEKEKKFKYRISVIICFVFVLLLVSGNYSNADTGIYLLRYNESKDWSNVIKIGQVGQAFLGYVCNRLGLSFQYFRLVYYFIGLFIIFSVAYKYIGKSTRIMFLYCIFPMIIDATQMKNFMAMAFLTLAISFLSKCDVKSKLLFIAAILIGATFHIILIAYLPMLIFCNLKYKKFIRYLSMTPIILFSFIFMLGSSNDYLTTLIRSSMTSQIENRVGRFFEDRGVRLGFLVYYLMTFVIIFILFQTRKQTKLYPSYYTNEQKQLLDVLFLCSIYSIVFMPLYIHAQDFSRLLRNFAPMIHIALLLVIDSRQKNTTLMKSDHLVVSKEALFIYIPYVFYLIYAFYYDIMVYKESVVLQFFTYNYYF